MLTIPLWFLAPAIAAVSAVGVYVVHSTTLRPAVDGWAGRAGYIMRKMHFPMSPLILGFVLGEMLEQNLRRALSISNGNVAILWQRRDENASVSGHRGDCCPPAAAVLAQTSA